MVRVVVAPRADADTDTITSYLGFHAGRSVAEKYLSRFEALYQRLADHPASGPCRPALGPDIRIAVVSPYIIIYRHSEGDDTVAVLRILHGHQEITRKLLSRSSSRPSSLYFSYVWARPASRDRALLRCAQPSPAGLGP